MGPTETTPQENVPLASRPVHYAQPLQRARANLVMLVSSLVGALALPIVSLGSMEMHYQDLVNCVRVHVLLAQALEPQTASPVLIPFSSKAPPAFPSQVVTTLNMLT